MANSHKRSEKGKKGYARYRNEGRLDANKRRKARKEHKNNVKLHAKGQGIYAKMEREGKKPPMEG